MPSSPLGGSIDATPILTVLDFILKEVKDRIGCTDQAKATKKNALCRYIPSFEMALYNFGQHYNKTNHETSFYENVNLKYLNHDAKSENLDLLFIKNIILMYNNLIYINEDMKLLADKFLFNLETKDAKFFMNDASEKVKVIKY